MKTRFNTFMAGIGLSILLAFVPITAAAGSGRLAITTTDEKVTYFELASSPQITFTANEMAVVTESGGEIRFPLTNLKNYVFENAGSGLSDIGVDNGQVRISVVGRTLTSSASDVNIYSLTGHRVLTSTASAGTPVSLESLLPGVYVVNTGGSSFKIALK